MDQCQPTVRADAWFLTDDGDAYESTAVDWYITTELISPGGYRTEICLRSLADDWANARGARGTLTMAEQGAESPFLVARLGIVWWDDLDIRAWAWGPVRFWNGSWDAGPEPPPARGIMAALRRAWK